jgi:hypothetical protein
MAHGDQRAVTDFAESFRAGSPGLAHLVASLTRALFTYVGWRPEVLPGLLPER